MLIALCKGMAQPETGVSEGEDDNAAATGEPERWQQLRALYDAVCDLPPHTWRGELERLTADPDLMRETLELLGAQTVLLERARRPLDALMARIAAPELQPGDTLGPWRLAQRLRSGGMGVVFIAERADKLYQQKVAVKLLHGLADARTAEHLAEERRILASLQHPNIARLYDGGATASGLPYLVMEFIDGQPLDVYCREHGLNLRQRLLLFVRVCRAVQAAHARLVVHCDLKPGNVLVREDGEPVLLDFGIARLLDGAGQGERIAYCTAAYAAPETLAGQMVGVGSDVFSLGVMLVELLTDCPSQRSADDGAQPVIAPSGLAGEDCPWRRSLRGDLDAIAARACALQPDARYVSVEALANDVQRYLDHRPVLARQGGRLYRAHRGLRRNWRAASVAALVLALSGVFVWRLEQERARAQQEAQVAEQVGQFMLDAFEAADPRKRGKGEIEATAREVLDAAATRIDSDAALTASPAMRARVRHVIGVAYMNVGQSRRGEELLRMAADELLALRVNRPLEAAEALSDLAAMLASGRDGEGAAQAAQRALQVLATAHGADKQAVQNGQAQALTSMGLALSQQEHYAQSLQAFEQASALRADQPDADRHRAGIAHNLGLLYWRWGKLDEAVRYLREALAAKSELYGSDSYDVWVSRSMLGEVMAMQGKPREATDLQQQNLTLALKLFGQDSAFTSANYMALGGYHLDMGDYQSSADYYTHALQISGRVAGQDSTSYAIALNNYAWLEQVRGNWRDAAAMYQRAMEISKARLGPDSGLTLKMQTHLAQTLLLDDELTQAKPLLDYALQVWSARLEPDAADLFTVRLALAEWQMRSGHYAAAHEQLQALQPLLSNQPPLQAVEFSSLQAQLLQRERRFAEAAEVWQQVVSQSQVLHGADTVTTAQYRLPWAETLFAAGRLDQAREQSNRAAPLLRDQMAPGADALTRLTRLQGRVK
ncbi:MAG: serine/threonine-protein kinase [Nevskiaceae bacterium]|nr:serine/threonine-protein kinase [Nevskiaceae bacterium]